DSCEIAVGKAVAALPEVPSGMIAHRDACRDADPEPSRAVEGDAQNVLDGPAPPMPIRYPDRFPAARLLPKQPAARRDPQGAVGRQRDLANLPAAGPTQRFQTTIDDS